MNKRELRLSVDQGVWICELWEPINKLKSYLVDSVTAPNFQALMIAIGNKKWIELLPKPL